jgi:hypothetical protein
MSVHLDFCSRPAGRYATRRWHYSGDSMPSGRLVCIGVWEFLLFVGALIFGRGAASNIGAEFGRPQSEVCELNRIALGPHQTPTSRILSIAVRLLKKQSPGLRLIVSYADPRHGHDGRGVYAAAGWLYLGRTHAERLIILHGKLTHARTVSSKYGTRSLAWLRANVDPHAEHVIELPKHKYVLPLDDAMRRQLAPRVQPYPKRDRGADGGARGPQAGEVTHSTPDCGYHPRGGSSMGPGRSNSEVVVDVG